MVCFRDSERLIVDCETELFLIVCSFLHPLFIFEIITHLNGCREAQKPNKERLELFPEGVLFLALSTLNFRRKKPACYRGGVRFV